MARFFVAPEKLRKEPVSLGADESHHAISVLRLKEGAAVQIFDGQGRSFDAVIREIKDREVFVSITGPSKRESLKKRISIAFSAIKPDRMDWLVEKACELGAHQIIPMISDRSVIHLPKERWDAKVQKWQKAVQESCKQCGLDSVPVVRAVAPFKQVLKDFASFDTVLIPYLGEKKNFLREAISGSSKNILILIGPEGDFTEPEIQQALAAGAKTICLGPLVLRSETAALYALSICHSLAV